MEREPRRRTPEQVAVDVAFALAPWPRPPEDGKADRAVAEAIADAQRRAPAK